MKRLMVAGIAAMTLACQGPEEMFCFDEMTYSQEETVFKLFAPADAHCVVVVDGDSTAMTRTDIPVVGNASERSNEDNASERSEGAVWTATIKGDLKGKNYVFVVDGLASPGVFAKAVTVNGEKGVVVDLRDSAPEGWADDKGPHPARFADWMVYELHHRDFSIARSGAQYPGKFLALSEPWAVSHLKELGINAIHILPSYDFGSVDETRLDVPQYNWGYDPVNYNVPEGSYSTDPADPLCRIREFKQMVQALHRAGINVILDVVYNHTYDIEHSNFQRTFPDYYYRQVATTPDATTTPDASASGYSNGSGCGNETASEKPMMRRFMIESVKYWINEYHIDGFRFDLMGCHDIETMNEIRKAVDEIDPTIFIYGEGWSAGACALPNEQLGMKANIPQMPGIAAFSDDLRDALRGPFSDDTKPGWLVRAGHDKCEADMGGLQESIKAGIAGMIAHPQVDYSMVNYSKEPYALEPTQMMAYVSCHDDMCLVDRLKASAPGISNDELIRLDLLAQTAVFTSQGVPFMLSGEELLRTKLGVHNSFESPDSINHLDWSNKTSYPQVFDYYRGLIQLRRDHPLFRLGSADLVRQCLSFLDTPDDVVAYRLTKQAAGDAKDDGSVKDNGSAKDSPLAGEPWQSIVVVLNASSTEQTIAIPNGQYTMVCANGRIDLSASGITTVSGDKVKVAPQSAVILHD